MGFKYPNEDSRTWKMEGKSEEIREVYEEKEGFREYYAQSRGQKCLFGCFPSSSLFYSSHFL